MLLSVLVRTFAFLGVAVLVGALFVRNAVSLAGDTHPAVWAAAAFAAATGALLFLLVSARPPRFLDRLARGARRGVLPLVAAAVAVIVVGSASTEGQLISLSLFAGFLATALAQGLRGRVGR
jgi:hypothetical protein